MGNRKSHVNAVNSFTTLQALQVPDAPSVDQERSGEDRNEEDVTLIWLDVQRDATDEETNKMKAMLRLINDYVLFYQDQETCLEYVGVIQKEKIFLILSGSASLPFLELVHDLKQVDSVFIFGQYHEEDRIDSLMVKYPKIIGIYDEIYQLRLIIRKTMDLLEKQTAAFSLYDQKQKATRDLSKESGSFLFFQLFKDVLLNMEQTIEAKREMIAKCRDYYRSNKKELANIESFQTTYKATEAIQWYTKDSFVYRLINKALRTEDIQALYTFRFYIIDLCTSLEKKCKELKKRQKEEANPILKLYRGLKQTKEEILILKENVGNLMSTNGYLSSSRLRTVAYDFAKKPSKRSDIEAVLFEITVDIQAVEKIILADVAEFSDFPNEAEVLFDLGAAFKIDSVKYDDEDKLWLIVTSATDKGAELANEYIEFQKKKVAESNIVLMFGHLLADMGEYIKSQQYFENVLRGRPNDEEVACVYHNIGRAHRLKGEYDHSLENYQKAYDMHSNARPPRLVSAAKTLNGMGILYNERHNHDEALNYLTRALKMYEKALQRKHADIAGTLNNIGNVYRDQGRYDLALQYLKRAQKINEDTLPPNHPNIALTYNNIGNVYYKRSDYKTALDYYNKALKLKEKALPADHPDIARGLNNIGLVYYSNGDYDTALEYYTKSLLMSEKSLPDKHPFHETIQTNIKLAKEKRPATENDIIVTPL
ncbi:unnamed protein product [Didymodactylos carnosus]|uniref:ADP ribosyltransferase domain-containing protein n=1 Tax=Didymodactylos carnosus TaxID=1234261 RepID=A0A814KMY6_9BILA|nr:unnamed protein product [Didymodactylos carnosus]CAF1054210.1 unnamed protein product [Didymodactylos carnosus]CAF3511904.1 unnamed protein product [Didymodactylos carnosus]CAF3823413.1 unnamed protein product [Didymodactylos carnosus]